MKLAATLTAALGLAAAAFVVDAPRSAQADGDISNQFSVSATQSGGTLTVTLTPANSNVFVNAEYPTTVKLTAKNGGSVGKDKLTNVWDGKACGGDASCVLSTHEGKATKITFTTSADKGATGTGKLVICSLDACGNPTSFSFDSN